MHPPEEPEREAGTRVHRLRQSHSYGFVLVLLVAAVVTGLIVPDTNRGRIAVGVLQAAALLTALWTSRTPRRLMIAATIVMILLGTVAIGITVAGWEGAAAVQLLSCALVASIPFAILRTLLQQKRIGRETVLGALCIYLLIGLFFASALSAAATIGGEEVLAATAGTFSGPLTFNDEVYFSFVTLTTIGYGDIVAANDLSRGLAIFEALLGQLYLVTVVSLVVGNLGRARTPREPAT